MSADNDPQLCPCGAEADEDSDFCSRQCGVAAALEKLTSGGERVASPPALDWSGSMEEESVTLGALLGILRGEVPPVSKHTSAAYSEPTRETNAHSVNDTHENGEQYSRHESRILDPARRHRISVETPYFTSGYSASCLALTTSTCVSSTERHPYFPDHHQQIPETPPLSITKKIRQLRHRSRTLPNLRASAHPRFNSEKSRQSEDSVCIFDRDSGVIRLIAEWDELLGTPREPEKKRFTAFFKTSRRDPQPERPKSRWTQGRTKASLVPSNRRAPTLGRLTALISHIGCRIPPA